MFQLHFLIMAKETSLCLLFLSFLIISCSGALVGFSYRERGDSSTSTSTATSTSTSAGTISFLQQSKVPLSQIRIFVTDHRILSSLTNSNVSVDFYLNKSQLQNFITSKTSASSGVKAHLLNFLPHLNLKSIIVSCGSECLEKIEMPLFLHGLKYIRSFLRELHIDREVKVSVAFPLSFLEKLNASHENHISKILSFIKEIKSFVMIEDSIEGELSTGDHFVESIIKRATLAASIFPYKDVPSVVTIKSLVIPSSMEVAQFSKKVSKYLEARTHIAKRITALYVEVHTTQYFSKKELEREKEELFSNKRRSLDDTSNPTNTVFPTNPASSTPIITPPDTPTIITVPSTNPVTISPTNPAAMPVTVPPTTPVPTPPTNPANSPVPVSNPATATPVGTPPPVTNPVTSNPPPSASVPVISTQPPPANTNAPTSQGQSWCVAKTGAPEASLQAGLDYACGMGGADCSQIQQGASCYSPVTLQNHASFAFNSYYQKNPSPTSCDFGGTATLVNTNPSSGSCIFSSSSSSSSSSTSTPKSSSPPTPPTQSSSTPQPPSPATPAPSIQTPPSIPTTPPTTSSSSASGTSGYGTPPSVLNSSNPASGIMPGFGSESPPVVNTTSASNSVVLRPFSGCIVLIVSFVTTRLIMRP